MAPPRTRARRLLICVGAALLGLGVAAAPAGANLISPVPAHSPQAHDLTTLYWIVAIVVVALIVIVNGALIATVARYRERRGREPRRIHSGRGLQARVAGVLAALAAAVFVVSIVFTEQARTLAPTGPSGLQASATITGSGAAPIGTTTPPAGTNPLQITATGQQWLWRYSYPNGAFSYYQLVLPVDTAVQLNLRATDVVHGWFVPALAGKFNAVPGKVNHVTFRADRVGNYYGRSSTFSGSSYAADRIEVSVLPPQEYQSFITNQKKKVQQAQDIVVRQIQSGRTP